jgi:hypothetical protein
MGTWQVALVREQGVNFAVICVRDGAIDSSLERDRLVKWWTVQLQQPVVLLGAQQHRLWGRRDIVDFLSNIDPARLPWRRMNVAA